MMVLITLFVFVYFWKGVILLAKTPLNQKANVKVEESSSLKGTLISVFSLGIFLIIAWVGVFILFSIRF